MPKTKLRLLLADSGDHRAWDLVVKGGAILWSRFAEMRSATRDRAGVVKLQKSAMRPGVAGRKVPRAEDRSARQTHCRKRMSSTPHRRPCTIIQQRKREQLVWNALDFGWLELRATPL